MCDCWWRFFKPSEKNILSMYSALKDDAQRRISFGSGRRSELLLEDQLLLTMMRLRLGRLEQELAYSFGIDVSNVSRIIQKWISYMYLHLGLLPIWPDWCDVEKTMPEMFRKSYPDTFIIIDATEIKCESPSNLFPQSQHYSTYKSHTTLKGHLLL